MDYSRPLHAPRPVRDCDVIILRCHDKLQLDQLVLARACAGQSPYAAEQMLCRILENIAYWLNVLQDGLTANCPEPCKKAARRIGLVAGHIGLTGLADAAGHVTACLQTHDHVALAATAERLERNFDLAVAEVWNFRDP